MSTRKPTQPAVKRSALMPIRKRPSLKGNAVRKYNPETTSAIAAAAARALAGPDLAQGVVTSVRLLPAEREHCMHQSAEGSISDYVRMLVRVDMAKHAKRAERAKGGK